MPSSSAGTVWLTRSVSSAYFSNRLMRFWGCMSEASMTNEHGEDSTFRQDINAISMAIQMFAEYILYTCRAK